MVNKGKVHRRIEDEEAYSCIAIGKFTFDAEKRREEQREKKHNSKTRPTFKCMCCNIQFNHYPLGIPIDYTSHTVVSNNMSDKDYITFYVVKRFCSKQCLFKDIWENNSLPAERASSVHQNAVFMMKRLEDDKNGDNVEIVRKDGILRNCALQPYSERRHFTCNVITISDVSPAIPRASQTMPGPMNLFVNAVKTK